MQKPLGFQTISFIIFYYVDEFGLFGRVVFFFFFLNWIYYTLNTRKFQQYTKDQNLFKGEDYVGGYGEDGQIEENLMLNYWFSNVLS